MVAKKEHSMSVQHPGDEDTLSYEWSDQEDPRNVYLTLDEQHPGEALRLRIGGRWPALAADEALTLLDWLGEREATLFELTEQQTLVAPDQGP